MVVCFTQTILDATRASSHLLPALAVPPSPSAFTLTYKTSQSARARAVRGARLGCGSGRGAASLGNRQPPRPPSFFFLKQQRKSIPHVSTLPALLLALSAAVSHEQSSKSCLTVWAQKQAKQQQCTAQCSLCRERP